MLKVDTASQPRVRLFRIAPEGTTVVPTEGLALAAADLRAGVELGIESKSFALPTWNGEVTVELVVTSAAGAELGKDSAVMRVAPFILQSDVQAPRTVYFADLRDTGHRRFQAQVTEGVVAGGAVARPIDSFKTEYTQRGQPDQWTQDHWTIGYTSMPVAGGVQRVMDVVLRAATEPRPAADFASVELLGHDFGYILIRAPPMIRRPTTSAWTRTATSTWCRPTRWARRDPAGSHPGRRGRVQEARPDPEGLPRGAARAAGHQHQHRVAGGRPC